MKTKQLFYLCSVSFILSHNPIKSNAQEIDTLDSFLEPVSFTRVGMRHFFTKIFNRSEYSRNFLPYNFTHLVSFLQYGHKTSMPRNYIKSVLDLFGQKLKSTNFIAAERVCLLFDNLQDIIEDHMSLEIDYKLKKSAISDCIYDHLLNDFELYKADPISFIDKLSDNVLKVISVQRDDQDISVEKLQQTVGEFFELILNKIIWTPMLQVEVWESVKLIACQLEKMQALNIISNDEALDKHYWSLVHRFCYFLDLAGSELSEGCYAIITKDLADNKIPLFQLDEQEAFIVTKKEQIKKAIFDGQFKARAKSAGIISEDIVPRKIKK